MNRIVYKILFTALSFVFTTIVFIVVARDLGAENYGKISFIFSTYDFLIQIFTLMIPTAYIFFLSENRYIRSHLNAFISVYVGFVTLSVFLLTVLTFNSELGKTYLWGEIDSYRIIFFSFLIVSAINIQNILLNFSDATYQTIKSENSRFFSKLFLFSLIIIFSLFELLVLETYLLILGLSLILFFFLYSRAIQYTLNLPNRILFKQIFGDFIKYIKPLIFFNLVAVFYIYFGKYVLQHTGGSFEQGYFGFSFQIAMLPVVIITPIMPIIMREFAENYNKENILEVRALFLDRFFRLLPLFGLASIFLVFNSEQVIDFTSGKDFSKAKNVIQILSIYSLLHIFGLFNSSLHLSTGRNREYGVITSITLVVGSLYLMYVHSIGIFNAYSLARVLVVVYLTQTFWLLFLNLNFLNIPKLNFVYRMAKVLSLITVLVFLVNNLSVHILYNILVCCSFGLLLNFLFKDYMGIKNLFNSFKQTRNKQ